MTKENPQSKQPTLAAEFKTQNWRVYNPRFSPDSKTLVMAAHDNVGLVLISVGNWQVRTLPKLEGAVFHLPFSPDGKSFLVPIFDGFSMQCLQTTTGSLLWELEPGSAVAAFSLDGKTLATTRKKSVLLCDPATGKILHEMLGHKSRVERVVFSPDGSRLASMGATQACLWDARKGKLIAVVQEKKGDVPAIGFSSDSRYLAVANAKGVIRLYESTSGKKHHEWQAHGCFIWRLDFTSDSKRLLTESYVGDDNSVRLWSFPDGREIYQVPRPQNWKITPDGKYAVIATGSLLELRDLETWQLAGSIELKTRSPVCLFAFSPDQNWLVCVLENEKTQIWQIKDLLRVRKPS
jgi:WD40 repeat protein